ncbi:MAG: hypothetical protein GXY67_10575 [Clostridiales bacterium]|nr:hypothetical protein [Clostridiales bacterium]
MGVNAKIKAALAPLPWPAQQHPAAGTQRTYLTWQELSSQPDAYRSNAPTRYSYQVQVNIFSREAIPDTNLRAVVQALQAAGVTVQYSGPRNYEEDTKLYHIPIICRWQEV